MTINAIERGTEVVTPSGRKGHVCVTRRERQLISDGVLHKVEILFANGHRDLCFLSELTEVVKEPEPIYMTKEEFIDEINDAHSVEELKEVINKMVVQLF